MLHFEIKKSLQRHAYLFLFLMGLLLSLFYFQMPTSFMGSVTDFPAEDTPAYLYQDAVAALPSVQNREELALIPDLEKPETYSSDMDNIDRLQVAVPEVEDESQLSKEERKEYIEALLKSEEATLRFFEDHLQKMPQFQDTYQKLKNVVSWHQVEGKYAMDKDVPLAYRTFMGFFVEDSYASLLYINFPVYFGPLFFILLALTFHSTVSRERSEGTIHLLWTQPVDRLRILLSKMGMMLLGALIYGMGILLGLLIGCLYQQIGLGGFERLLRYLTTPDSVQGMPIWVALIQMMVGALALTVFFTGVLLFFSSHFSSTTSLAFLSILLAMGSIVTSTGNHGIHPLNPYALMDYLHGITGKVLMGETEAVGAEVTQTAWGLKFYLFWVGIGFVFVLLTSRAQQGKGETHIKRKETSSIGGLSGFLRRKIVNRPSFPIYLAGFFLVCAFFFIQKHSFEEYWEQVQMSDPNRLNYYDSNIDFWKETYEHEISPQGMAAYLGVPVDEMPPFEEWPSTFQTFFQQGVDRYKKELERAEQEKQSRLNWEKAYREGNGALFWKSENEVKESYYSQGYASSDYVKGGVRHELTMKLTEKTLEEASRRNVAPFLDLPLLTDPREGFENLIFWAGQRRRDAVQNTSASYWLYQLIIVYRLPLVFLLLMGLMTLGGYSLDREEGDQLALVWTQPISRMRYHTALVMQQFFLAVLVLLVFLLLQFGIGAVFSGIGPWNFPLPYFSANKWEINFISLWLFLIKTVGIMVAYLFFLSALSGILSLFLHQEVHVFAGLIAVSAGGALLTHFLPKIGKAFSPFSYFSGDMVVDGSLYYIEKLTRLPYAGVLAVIVGWGLVLLMLGMIAAKRKKNY